MSDFDREVEVAEEVVESAPPEDHVEYLEDGVGPNFRVAIAPNGYIWFSLNVDLMTAQAYCDAKVARVMARMLNNAADEHARIVAEIESREMLAKATNVIDLGKVRDAKLAATSDEEVGSLVGAAHDEDVADAIEAADSKFD